MGEYFGGPYIGHESQISGVEEHILVGGKGNGLRLLEIRNGRGLWITISPDRAADITRLNFNGSNIGYFAPAGYVAPAYYDKEKNGFLKSFTAGFFTTCGLTAAGAACVDEGEAQPLHGTISNIPAESFSYTQDEEKITVTAKLREASLFGHMLALIRKYTVFTDKNSIKLEDSIVNIGDEPSPLMLIYHCNMGYPLLSENAELVIPNNGVVPRDAVAAPGLADCLKMEKPQQGYAEQCFYYDVVEKRGYARAGIYNSDVGAGLVLRYKKGVLNCMNEWKMMGIKNYVLGLEPGNCTPDGRDKVRAAGKLKYIAPGETVNTELNFDFFGCHEGFAAAFN